MGGPQATLREGCSTSLVLATGLSVNKPGEAGRRIGKDTEEGVVG